MAQLSEKGKNYTKGIEGCVLHAYLDATGTPTIGHGITTAAGLGTIKLGMKISQEQADQMFDQASQKYLARVHAVFGPMPQQVIDGAFSFDWNTGKIKTASWPKKYLRGQLSESEASLKLWNKSKGKVLAGLTRRRAEEADIIFRGKYPATVENVHVDVQQAQIFLSEKGLYSGIIDGINGPRTRAAVKLYQEFHPHLKNDGVLGAATMTQMYKDAQLVKTTLKDTMKQGGPLAILFGALGQFWDVAGPYWPIALGGILLVVVGYSLYKRRDVIQQRINRLRGKKVMT